MATSRIREQLVQHEGFQRKIDQVIRVGVEHELPAIVRDTESEDIDWNRLLLCASALARAEKSEQQRIALRIADTCLKISGPTEAQKSAAAIVLEVMANLRAEKLAEELNLVKENWDSELPLPLRADRARRSMEDVITTANSDTFPVNRFQHDFWKALKQSARVSASAPTSAGKSFILRMWVAETFRLNPAAKVVVVVPTRALIQEFSEEFGHDIDQGVLKGVTVHTLPLDNSIEHEGGHLFVFTQERLHILLSRGEQIAFDLIIVDEAQKIGDGYRGVLLEQVIDECLKRNEQAQIVYASPFSENPDYLVRNEAKLLLPTPVKRDVTTVTQNLLFVKQVKGSSTNWEVTFENDEKEISIGKFQLHDRPTSPSRRVTFVALALGKHTTGNLVYANGPAEAEKYAQQLYDAIGDSEPDFLVKSKRVDELIKLVRKTVHEKYNLAHTLKRGVAYHYGNMPLLIRTEIEALFRDRIIRYLVCTGTLIEGVNLPCKAIYMRGPTKGRGKPMQDSDFWNLAGRAGRWGKEFHGTIVCIDPTDKKAWPTPPPKIRARQKIKSAVDESLVDLPAILKYVENSYPKEVSDKHPEYDYTLSYLFHLLVRDQDLHKAVGQHGDADTREALRAKLDAELSTFSLPSDLVFAHPGILPTTMSSLVDRLSKLSDDELLSLSPVEPEAPDAVDVYLRIFRYINEELRPRWSAVGPASEGRLKQLAYLVVDWMSGKPLALLIKTRIKIQKWRENQQSASVKPLPSIIIDVMRDVEECARYKIPKFLKAFLDILYLYAQARKLDDRLNQLPDLELWMEFGVSTKTQLGLMELGLSRTSAIEVTESLTNTELSKEASLAWLREANLDGLQLPGPVLEEVKKMLERHSLKVA